MEISLEGSTSKHMKNFSVIDSNNHRTDLPVQDIQLTFHISSLVRITAAVLIHQLCSIITRESEHPDRSKCPYYIKMLAYSTSAAFIDRKVFESYFSEVVFSDITRIQSKLRSKTDSNRILYNRSYITANFTPINYS